MTENQVAVEEVRLALGTKVNARGYRIFSSEARAKALAFAHERMKAGATSSEVSAEIGLIGWTLQRWLQHERRGAAGESGTASGFVQLEVKTVVKPEPVLHGAFGVWVEGLEIEGIAAVLKSLSCSA